MIWRKEEKRVGRWRMSTSRGGRICHSYSLVFWGWWRRHSLYVKIVLVCMVTHSDLSHLSPVLCALTVSVFTCTLSWLPSTSCSVCWNKKGKPINENMTFYMSSWHRVKPNREIVSNPGGLSFFKHVLYQLCVEKRYSTVCLGWEQLGFSILTLTHLLFTH